MNQRLFKTNIVDWCYSKCHLLELSDEHMSWHDLVLLMPTYKQAGYHLLTDVKKINKQFQASFKSK